MSIVDGWVLEGCSGAVGRNRPWVDQMDWMARSGGVGRTQDRVRPGWRRDHDPPMRDSRPKRMGLT